MNAFFAQTPRYSGLVLRLGLAAVLLWFGVNELLNPSAWTIWVPAWTGVFGLAPLTVVYLNGVFEVVAAALLVFGLSVRIVAFVLFVHMLLIAFDIGMTAIGVRDFGLAIALLALAMGIPRTGDSA